MAPAPPPTPSSPGACHPAGAMVANSAWCGLVSVVVALDVVIAAWDRRLHAGAATAGLPVAPAELPRAGLSSPPAQQATDS